MLSMSDLVLVGNKDGTSLNRSHHRLAWLEEIASNTASLQLLPRMDGSACCLPEHGAT